MCCFIFMVVELVQILIELWLICPFLSSWQWNEMVERLSAERLRIEVECAAVLFVI